MKRAIVIMAKAPVIGKVKTRLQPTISPEQSAELAAAFLLDSEHKAKNACDKTILAFAPFEKRTELLKLLKHEHVLIEQKGADLGEKMFHAFEFAFAQGSDAVVMLGTDSPTLPADFIEQAFEFLETNSDVVLGKTEDGGFYLIGLRILRKEIFESVQWSSAKAFEQVRRNVMNLDLHLREVPSWYDVDTPADLEKLKREFVANQNAQRRAPQTFTWLKENT